MGRKRLTQRFPFLLPLRRAQRKLFFYGKMRFDHARYAKGPAETYLPYEAYRTVSPLLNDHSGFDMTYQYNKVFNLQLAARKLDRLLIRPGETFSFFWAIRGADRDTPYKEGLNLVYGQIEGDYGGGLCQLSSMLYWLFLHTPITVVERHGHGIESFPTTTEDLPCGTDATISEGWLDLKVRNDTPYVWQLAVTFDAQNMYGRILCQQQPESAYRIYNGRIAYYRQQGRVFQKATVRRETRDGRTGRIADDRLLYENICEIGYPIDEAALSAPPDAGNV